MGISLSFSPLIIGTLARTPQKARLITLGRQDFDFGDLELRLLADQMGVDVARPTDVSTRFTQEEFFERLGVGSAHSLDVSDFEGASHILDLNAPPDRLPQELVGAYDVVLNGGTLEHIFHIMNGLQNTLGMVNAGGVFIHIGPMHNYVDHGFYQFSPTFFFDYAAANHWRVLESAAIGIIVRDNRVGPAEISPLPPGRFGAVGALDAAPWMHYVVMRREAASTTHIVPKQGYYQGVHGEGRARGPDLSDFTPYRVDGGRIVRL